MTSCAVAQNLQVTSECTHSHLEGCSPLCSSVNKPEMSTGGKSCSEYYHEQLLLLDVWSLSLGKGCHEVQPMREKYRRHGLINIYLTQVCLGLLVSLDFLQTPEFIKQII